jgi:hypothetical protein
MLYPKSPPPSSPLVEAKQLSKGIFTNPECYRPLIVLLSFSVNPLLLMPCIYKHMYKNCLYSLEVR